MVLVFLVPATGWVLMLVCSEIDSPLLFPAYMYIQGRNSEKFPQTKSQDKDNHLPFSNPFNGHSILFS